MPVEIDGYAVLAAIGRSPEAFPAVKADVVKVAKTFVGKQIKEKALTLAHLRNVAKAVGSDAFDLIVDGMSDSEVKSLLSKVDKHSSDLKGDSPQQRRCVSQLAKGLAEPAERAVPPEKTSTRKEPKPKVERSGNSRAMSARKKLG